jgi:RNA polymerase sigma-70 factor (ECF subfamily)
VQDAYIRWTERGGDAIRDAPGWLATVTARIAIDRGRTLARRRETYVGEWLPEPLIERGPADEVDVADDLTIGFLRVLERLRPDERTALLLHDAFDYSHAEVAAMLDKSEEAVRQMTSRARHRVHEERPRFALDRRAAEKATQRFITALRFADRLAQQILGRSGDQSGARERAAGTATEAARWHALRCDRARFSS